MSFKDFYVTRAWPKEDVIIIFNGLSHILSKEKNCELRKHVLVEVCTSLLSSYVCHS